MRLFITLFIFTFFVNISIFGKDNRDSVFFLYNRNYDLVFEEDLKISTFLKTKFKRDFFRIRNYEVPLISSLDKEIELIAKQEYNTIFFAPPLISSMIVDKSSNFNRDKTKLLSYGLYIEDNFSSNISVFNIIPDPDLMTEKLLSIIKKRVKNNDFSKCGIVIDPDYEFPNSVVENFKERGIELTVLQSNINNSSVIQWISYNDLSIVICFAYSKNSFLRHMLKKDVENTDFIEVLTSYHLYENDFINYYISINWEKSIEYAVSSSAFRKFRKDKSVGDVSIKKIENFLSKNKNAIVIQKFSVNSSNKNRVEKKD